MTFLHGGPADLVQLALLRSPKLLRVTRNAAGEWDALDQLDDAPAEGEEMFCYRRSATGGWIHIDYTCSKTKRRKGGWWRTVDYHFLPDQPAQETMASTEKWRAWCELTWEMIRDKEGKADEPAPEGKG